MFKLIDFVASEVFRGRERTSRVQDFISVDPMFGRIESDRCSCDFIKCWHEIPSLAFGYYHYTKLL
jgi:hypothetical protein